MGHLQTDIDHAAGGVGPGQTARGGPMALSFSGCIITSVS